ncbi:hypothetical protein K469DRAFT_661475 [Zopfia rhizophila CBS 207.26]|uniref:Uncharacterized protein n=1 Tax=Zopfia rhizophila CBS 207.26 TaxID=1314779 RepID=A0A6A6EBY1_9PEZI|nr:hypothetical protein K469DRAFT_661475 [Zopfia rhizophila CBS 207.26]
MILFICNNISKGLPLAVGRCRIDGDDLVSLFTFDAAKHTLAFAPLSELEYEYGENRFLQGKPKRNFWAVKDSGQSLKAESLERAREKLKSFGLHHGESLSECFEAQKLEPNPSGVWSPRLSRLGFLKRSEGGLWETRPLRKGWYRRFSIYK